MKTKENILPTVIALVALGVSLALGFFVLFSLTQARDWRKDFFITNAQLGYKSDRLQFCVNHKIAPCEDSDVTTWNQAHPGEQFEVKTFQQVTEGGIGDYNASLK